MQGGAGPPFQNPPFGILGAPSAPPFGPRGRTWRTREEGLRRPGGALASSPIGPFPLVGRLGGGQKRSPPPKRGAPVAVATSCPAASTGRRSPSSRAPPS